MTASMCSIQARGGFDKLCLVFDASLQMILDELGSEGPATINMRIGKAGVPHADPRNGGSQILPLARYQAMPIHS